MSLRAQELAEVVDELSASLPRSLVQKAFVPELALCYLELRHRSRSVLLCLCVGRERARISVAESRRPSPETALPFQQLLRRELIGTSLVRIAREGERMVALDFRNAARSRRLIADLGARDAKLVLLGEDERILGISSELDSAKSGLKPGGIYLPPGGDPTAPRDAGARSRRAASVPGEEATAQREAGVSTRQEARIPGEQATTQNRGGSRSRPVAPPAGDATAPRDAGARSRRAASVPGEEATAQREAGVRTRQEARIPGDQATTQNRRGSGSRPVTPLGGDATAPHDAGARSRPAASVPGEEATAQREPGTGSRLVPIAGAPFPLAQAAEALYGEKDEQLRADETLRRLLRSLKKKIDRIERTREKVLAEAARGAQAEEHRRIGELVSQNLHRIPRGEKIARLTEYTEHGPVEVEVPLHPERSPKQEAEWHFHQYRRLLRGGERASARLADLDEQLAAARQDMENWHSAGPEELLGKSDPSPSARRKPLPRSRPYKEYFSSKGERIWVGRDSRSNDELTFKIARPEDLWLHARGASGSHVVVPLEKKAEVGSELLVDAAHLALHHSSFKGEPRGEIIYVRAKHVRRRKGDPAGSVNVEREKSLTVRIDPERLARLLGSRSRGSID